MSAAGQGILTGPESADILSQALLQTGLSDAIKMEERNIGFDLPSENLLSCDVQTLTDDLISQLDENGTQGSVLSNPGALESPFDGEVGNKPMKHHSVEQNSGIPMCTAAPVSSINTTPFVNGYSNSGPLPVKVEGGLCPPQGSVTSTVRQPGTFSAGGSSATGYEGGADIDLEDLLAIDVVDHLDADMYSAPPSNQMTRDFPSQPSSFAPVPGQYGSYQSPSNGQDLPELVNTDLYDILGEDEDSSFLDSLVEPPNNIPYIQNGSALGLSGVHQQQQQQTGFGGPMSYAPSPPNVRPYMSNSHMSNTTLPPAYTASSSRQFQQPVAIPNRPYTLQQQMYMKMQGPRRPPITSSPHNNRFPNAPRPFQIPGSSKVATGAQESQVMWCVWGM